jgi:glycosyltransferase involved in cell wall biosynthesis|tara:strand:+ start:39 stop:1139 length:1101 start_codon:yes stop_codon:yes gene_type:complete
MSNLKVVQLLPELNIGGVERGTKDFSKALIDKGHQSIVISNGGIFEDDIVSDGGHHIKIPVHKKTLSSFFLSKKLKAIYESEKPDIVHVRSRMPAWINYYAFKKMSDKPLLISTFHGIYSTPIYSQVMAKVDHMIAISKTVKKYIIDTYNAPESSITTIPRGCDINTFNKEPVSNNWIDSWYKEYPQTKNKIILMLPTRISKWKGVDSFIELISNLDGDKFHGLVVGPTSNSKKRYLKFLNQKVSKLGIKKNITFTGSRNDIKNIYKISDIVFNLSIQPEPFGRSTIEAISSGAKVIGWDHGGTKEILDELFPEGLVSLNNLNDLKEKVMAISNDNHPYPMKNIFTSERMTQSTIDLYHQLLNRDS